MKSDSSKAENEQQRFMPVFDRRLTLTRKPIPISRLALDDAQFELSFIEEVVQHDPCNEDALMLLGHAYTRRGDYERGLAIDRRLTRLRPGDPTVYYNLACSYSLLRRIEDAFGALEKAVSLGYRDLNHVLRDPDLANLRNEPEFGEFANRLFGGPRAES